MQPNTKSTAVVLVLCMALLGILLLPLPLPAYKVLKFFLSLCLLYAAGFFLRPCKKLKFQPSADRLESGTRNPVDGSFSGSLRDLKSGAPLDGLTRENSAIVRFVDDDDILTRNNPLPPVSLKLSLALVVAALVMNPLTPVHLPKTSWMVLDVLVIALAASALRLIREENAGNRSHVPLTRTVGQPPGFPFMSVDDLWGHALRLWPAVLGGAFAIALLGTQVGDGEFEDIRLGALVFETVQALLAALVAAWLIYCFTDATSNQGVVERARRRQVPGEFFLTVFLFILLSLAFGGFFTPEPPFDPRDAPDGYDWADEY